jgi:HAMP domain-containing protein
MSVTTIYAITPALPLHTAGPYVAAAYIVFLAIVLIYVAIMARRLVRNQRELAELRRELEQREQASPAGQPVKQGPATPAPANPDREVSHQL